MGSMMLLAPLFPLPSVLVLPFASAMYSPPVPWKGLQKVSTVALLPELIVVVRVCVTSLEYVVASVLQPLELPAIVLP